jgi:hypothetical protein
MFWAYFSSSAAICRRLQIQKSANARRTMPATEAITAAAMYPGAILEDFSLPSRALAGDEGIEVTVCVTIEPL